MFLVHQETLQCFDKLLISKVVSKEESFKKLLGEVVIPYLKSLWSLEVMTEIRIFCVKG